MSYCVYCENHVESVDEWDCCDDCRAIRKPCNFCGKPTKNTCCDCGKPVCKSKKCSQKCSNCGKYSCNGRRWDYFRKKYLYNTCGRPSDDSCEGCFSD